MGSLEDRREGQGVVGWENRDVGEVRGTVGEDRKSCMHGGGGCGAC